MDGIRYASFPDPGQQATIRILANAGDALQADLDDLGDSAVLLAGRAGGQTVLQGLTVEDGLVVNDLGEDRDARFEGANEPNLLVVKGSGDGVGVGTADPSGLQVNAAVSQVARGATNVRAGVDTTPRVIFEHDKPGSVIWQIDNFQGSFRWFTPGVVRMLLTKDGSLAIGGSGSFGNGAGVIFIANRTTPPSSAPTGGALLSVDSGVAKVWNAGASAERRVSLGAQHARLAAAQNSSSTTLADLTLAFNLEAGRTYEVFARLYSDCNNCEGINVSLTGTATATAIVGYQCVYGHSFGALSSPAMSRFTALPGGGGFSQAAAVDSGFVEIFATITVNAAGTLKLQFARFGAAGTATIQRGSTFRIQEIA